MALLSAAAAVFPSMTLHELIWEVPESFLYQAENIYASRRGYGLFKRAASSVADQFRATWEKVTGRKWRET